MLDAFSKPSSEWFTAAVSELIYWQIDSYRTTNVGASWYNGEETGRVTTQPKRTKKGLQKREKLKMTLLSKFERNLAAIPVKDRLL